jgi:hypothetical protein
VLETLPRPAALQADHSSRWSAGLGDAGPALAWADHYCTPDVHSATRSTCPCDHMAVLWLHSSPRARPLPLTVLSPKRCRCGRISHHLRCQCRQGPRSPPSEYHCQCMPPGPVHRSVNIRHVIAAQLPYMSNPFIPYLATYTAAAFPAATPN